MKVIKMNKQNIFVSLIIFFIVLNTVAFAGDFIGIGETAPDFTLRTVEGDTVILSKVIFDEGKIVLLNFFGWN
jgi:hypothetical protein